jgi:tetratricopeptide (TPR) repeat protein
MNTRIAHSISRYRPASCAVLLAVFIFLAGCRHDPRLEAEKHYSRAQAYLHDNKPEAALIELGRAVQLQPDLAKAHHELANLYLQRGDAGSAVRQLLLLIHYDSEDQSAYKMLSELLLNARDFGKAKEFASKMVEKWPEDRVAKLILAEAMMGGGDSASAQLLVEQVLTDDPKNARALFDTARLQLQSKKWADAEQSLRRSWDIQPSGFVTPLVLSQLLEARGDFPGALSVLKRMADLHPATTEPLYALAGFYIRHAQLTQAEVVFRQIQTIGHASPRDRASLALFYRASGRNGAAEEEFQRLLSENPNDKPTSRGLAETEISLNKREEARRIVNDLIRRDGNDWEALLISASLDVDDGKPEQALKGLEHAKAIHPGSPMIHFQTARSYLLQQKTELARNSLNEALKSAPDFLPARLLMAELDLRTGQTKSAIRNLNLALERKPSSVTPYLLLSEAYALEGDFPLAEGSLKRLVDPKNSVETQALIFQTMAWVKLRQGRYTEAIQLAAKSLNMGPLTREGLQVLGLSYLGNKQAELGFRSVETYLRKADHWGSGQQVLGELALQAGNLEVAEKAYQKALEIDSKSDAAVYGLGQVYRGRRQYGLSRDYFERFALAEPANGTVHVQLAGLAELNQDWPKAISEYQKALELDQTNAIGKNNLAWLYAEHGGDISVALRLAQEARSALPKDPHVADTLGWLLVKIGSAPSAVPYLKECTGAIPGNPAYHYHLGTAYFNTGQSQQAQQELQTALRLRASFEGSDEARKALDTIKASASN